MGVEHESGERTANIFSMVVTLDVSKLTDWLNFSAPCRVERRAYDARRDAGRGSREGIQSKARCRTGGGRLGAAVERMVIVGQNRRGVLKKNRKGGEFQESSCVEARSAPKT